MRFVAWSTALYACLCACTVKEEPNQYELNPKDVKPVLEAYAVLAEARLAEAVEEAATVVDTVVVMVADPDSVSLNNIKVRWSLAHNAWVRSLPLSGYGGPVDDAYDRINYTQLDEANIDYVSSDLTAGIINNTLFWETITPELLVELHQKDEPKEVTLGFHVIEFLVYGEDFDAEDPGDRGFEDYIPELEGGTHDNQDRRGQFLTFAAEILVNDLTQLHAEWAEGGAYRGEFVDLGADEGIRRILVGMRHTAADLVAERWLLRPYEQKDGTLEPSEFSDSTLKELPEAIVGLESVWFGRLDAEIDGKGMDELVAAIEPDGPAVNQRVVDALAACENTFQAIPPPFDASILLEPPEDAAVKIAEAIVAVNELVAALDAAALLLGVDIDGGGDSGESGSGSGESGSTSDDSGSSESDDGTFIITSST